MKMDYGEEAFQLGDWSESVASVDISYWGIEQSPQNVTEMDEQLVQEQVMAMEEMVQLRHPEQKYSVRDGISPHSISQSLEEMSSDNLIYEIQDENIDSMIFNMVEPQLNIDETDHLADEYYECVVAEEIITDDWVQTPGQDRVEVEVKHFGASELPGEEIDITLPTDQDEYSATRPFPCDFCSQRFRTETKLHEHMVSHQTDQSHCCNLCGSRFDNKTDLLNHLKSHAYAPVENEHQDMVPSVVNEIAEDLVMPKKPSRKCGRGRKKQEKVSNDMTMSLTNTKSVSEDTDEKLKVLKQAADQHFARQMCVEPRYPVTNARKPFVCQHCGVAFTREKALASHVRIHGGDSPFECETCGEMFWVAQLLREHTRITHQTESSNSDYEPDENEESDTSDSGSKFGDYYCNACGMSFQRVDHLQRHTCLHAQEGPEEWHMCNVCGKTFREALYLLAHTEVHAAENPHRCFLCGDRFEDDFNLSTHVQSIHRHSLSKYSCNICGKYCRDRSARHHHSWEHNKLRGHTCTVCEKSFSNQSRLNRHMQSHRNKYVSCNICGDQFPDGRSLLNHQHSHSTGSGRQYPCRECGKKFGSRSSQQIHIRIHTGERPYACRFCWKAFADGGTLRKHERIHTGEKPYACPVCHRAFNQRVVLREHIRNHHSSPDMTSNDARNPYSCSVCNSTFPSSQDLVQHLIGHSDNNTAMKREPQVGPRQYKRRSKMKPYEVDRFIRRTRTRKQNPKIIEEEHESDVWYSDNSLTSLSSQQVVPQHSAVKKLQPKKQIPKEAETDDASKVDCESFESVMQDFITFVKDMKENKDNKKLNITSEESSRPKMIHTARMRVNHRVEGKKKMKMVITRIPTPQSIGQAERVGPRTKNVTYRMVESGNLPLAVFPGTPMPGKLDEMESFPSTSNNISVGSSTTRRRPLKDIKGKGKFNNDLVHDIEEILQIPMCPKLNVASDSRRSKKNLENFPKEVSRRKKTANKKESSGTPKRSFKTPKQARKMSLNHTVSITDFEDVIVKEELTDVEDDSFFFRCEICSKKFSTRADLLVHVPNHI